MLLPASFATWATPVAVIMCKGRLRTFKSPPAKEIPPPKFSMVFQKVTSVDCPIIQFVKNVCPAIEATDGPTEVATVVRVTATDGATDVACAYTAIEGPRIIVYCVVLAFLAKIIVSIMKVMGDCVVLLSSLYSISSHSATEAGRKICPRSVTTFVRTPSAFAPSYLDDPVARLGSRYNSVRDYTIWVNPRRIFVAYLEAARYGTICNSIVCIVVDPT